MAASYSFVSRWSVPAPPERTWTELERSLTSSGEGAPWWPGVRLVDAPERLAVGEALTLVVRSPVGYRLRVRLVIDHVAQGRALEAAGDGDLRGRGRIEITPDGASASALIFHWHVETRRRWMNATSWALRPVFERAHAHVMRAGERGLRAALARAGG